MNSSNTKYIDKAQDHYNHKNYEASLSSANAAIEIDSDSVNGWWFAGLSLWAMRDKKQACDAFEIVVDLAPGFAVGWAMYGVSLETLEWYSDAMDAYREAIKIDPENVVALSGLIDFFCEMDDEDFEEEEALYLLTQLDKVQGLTSNQLNWIGRIHYNRKNFFDAIKYWDRDVQFCSSAASLFNIGLAYNHPEVSQDADAVDVWRLAQKYYPNYERSYKKVQDLLPRLLKLKNDALDSSRTLLSKNQWYQHYINPFELLGIQKNQFESVDEIDAKTLQKLKKKLIQEIELEDGEIQWMEGLRIDRSTAIGICDSIIDNQENRKFHWIVFINTSLLWFLTRGEHKHFTVDKEYSPLDTIEYLGNYKNGFRAWLSEPFTKQFDLVLSKAVADSNLPVLEVLLDGRRWIDPSYTEQCFMRARKKIDHLLEGLREAESNSKHNKPSLDFVQNLLNQNSLLQMLNLFPTHFWGFQDEAVSTIRNIAINCYNVYEDIDLSKNILDLSKLFVFKSAKANKLIKDDFEAVNDILQQERQAEVILKIGGEKCSITKEGVRKNDFFIPADSITAVRWGTTAYNDYSKTSYDFLFNFKGKKGNEIQFHWKTTSDIENQQKYNSQLIDATLEYIFPNLIETLNYRLMQGMFVEIGECVISKKGIEFSEKGYFFTKSKFIPWNLVGTEIENGQLIISNLSSKKENISLSLRDVDNAIVIEFLKKNFAQ